MFSYSMQLIPINNERWCNITAVYDSTFKVFSYFAADKHIALARPVFKNDQIFKSTGASGAPRLRVGFVLPVHGRLVVP
jgi:hypothetical protein